MSHNPTVADIWQAVTEWAPSSLAEEWDNVGIQLGDPAAHVKRVVTALDVSISLVEFAVSSRADMILTHHPLIFTPIKKLDLSAPLPGIISACIKNDIAVASAHTNLDSAENGVSDQLAAMLELQELRPLVPSGGDSDVRTGIGRAGRLYTPRSLEEIIQIVCSTLKIPGVTAVGEPSMIIETAAVCGGSGSSLWPSFLEAGCDLFLTAEVKHSILREAELKGCAVIDAGHFATEWPIVPVLTDYIREVSARRQWGLDVNVFAGETMPGIWRPCKT